MPAREKAGIEVEAVAAGSPAQKAGVAAGDTLISVNGNAVSDALDYAFYKDDYPLRLVFRKAGTVALELEEGETAGIGLKQFPIKKCRNRCLFCFVAQLPKGLRKTLYVKDEDYRMSFIYGNYITMTNLTGKDRERIAGQRLSPLYISVHSTETGVRNHLLGNQDAPDIMKELRFLRENKLRAHTQIVLCPGINDGAHLVKTIRDLYSLYPYIMSIAVVPVGLTAHRKSKIRPFEAEDAALALETIEGFQKRFKKKHGDTIVYGADELYIKAGAAFPPLEDYGELPQIENGVGLVPLFMRDSKRLKPSGPSGKRYLMFTGTSFYPYLKRFVDRMVKHGHDITLMPVINNFFGPSVTVTGLLTGRDVLSTLAEHAPSHDILLVPDTVMRDGGDVFLDDVTLSDMEAVLGIKARLIEASPRGIISALEEK
ncbi:MAG: DUF512 domain-containing protein [Nitrospiraceae bacterium]|nr:DUF512 domain-containing protein [Nitrospiraceae bacterium]